MKLLDKYLLRSFLGPLGYCLTTFCMIYVIFDLFNNLGDFIEGGTPFAQVLRFYAILIPGVLIYIVPVSLLLSVLYALSTLTKRNELTAMRASGVSIMRLMFPYMIVGFLASVVVASVHETIGPWSMYWTEQFVRSQRRKGEDSLHVAFNLAFKNEIDHRNWIIGRFDTRTFQMEDVVVIQQREDESDAYKIMAKTGRWLDGAWWFSDLITQNYDQWGNPRGAPVVELHRRMSDFAETPRAFVNEIKDPQYLSSRELIEFLATHPRLSVETVRRYKVDLHHRLAMPWTCLIVTLMGIPFGAQMGRKGALLGVVLAITLFFSFYVLVNIGLWMGKTGLAPPWAAGWAPDAIYAVLAGVLLHRMR